MTTMLTPASANATTAGNSIDDSSNGEQHLEQVQALLTALHVLSQLSSMDSTVYQSTLVRSQHTIANGDKEETPSSCHYSASQLQQAIDALQMQWKLEETPVPLLAHSIHRLHSHITVLQSEMDQQAAEMEELRCEIQDLDAQKSQLAKFTKSLQCQNEELTSTIRKLKRQKKTLIKAVKTQVKHSQEQVQEHQELLELNHLFRLQAHEQTLSMTSASSATTRSYCQASPSSSNLDIHRKRTCTEDTDVSECTSATTSLLTDHDDSQSSSSMDYCCDFSASHTLGDPSLVTDEGIATVKFLPPTTPTALSQQSSPKKSSPSSSPTVTLTFPCGTKMGLRVRPVELEASPLTHHKKATSSASFTSSSTSTDNTSPPSQPREQQQRSRSNSPQPRKGLITNSMLNGDEDGLQSPSTTSSTRKEQQQDKQPLFSINLSALRGFGNKSTTTIPPCTVPPPPLSKTEQPSPCTTNNSNNNSNGADKNSKRLGFLVYGYTDKCEIESDQRPPIGARIVAINSIPVSEQWTMSQLLSHMKDAEYPPPPPPPTTTTTVIKNDDDGDGNNGGDDGDDNNNEATGSTTNYESRTYSVTFRIDPLNKKQKEILALSPHEFQELTASSKSKNKSSAKNHSNRKNKFDARSFFTPPTSPSPSFHNNKSTTKSDVSSPSLTTTTSSSSSASPSTVTTRIDVAGFQLPKFF